jgi:hypothetical protein
MEKRITVYASFFYIISEIIRDNFVTLSDKRHEAKEQEI